MFEFGWPSIFIGDGSRSFFCFVGCPGRSIQHVWPFHLRISCQASPISRKQLKIMSTFTVGEQVNVESRTWPGINKPGGVGKIVKIHSEGPGIVVAVDVRYILGGTEKEVELQYVTKHEDLNRGGRSRSRREVMNLGREEKSSEKPTRRSSASAAVAKPKKSASANANAGSAKKKKAPVKKAAANKDAGSSKRKSPKKDDAATKKRKTDTSKGKKSSASASGKKAATVPPMSAASQSDSDSVVVSADESELSVSHKPPAATKKKAAAPTKGQQTQPKKKVTITASSNADSRSMPPPPPAAGAAYASAKPASKFKVHSQHPKLKNVDRKNTSAAAATSAKAGQSTLQKVHESNSRAASSFVDDIVGGAGTAGPAPAAQPAAAAASMYADDVSTVLCVGDEQSTVTGAHTRSTSSGALSVDAQ